ncbi:hypothetical protein CKO36_09150 [Rhabdochromatium marinum]|nr:hypothetical protein [Rhabdochromatium marinum]
MLQEEGILFCYSGYMTEDVLLSIGKAIKEKLMLENADKSVIRGIFSIFVEEMQNVIRYSGQMESKVSANSMLELRFGILSVGRKQLANDQESFFVACGNMVSPTDAQRLKTNLDHIQALDAQELKTLYKQTLKGKSPEGSKGAGVGFIDIARKSKRGFEYDFIDISTDRTFFSITAYA